MSLTLSRSREPGAVPFGPDTDFWALGQRWLLVEGEEPRGVPVAGRLHWQGRDYLILSDMKQDGASLPGERNNHGHICAEVLAILTPRELQVCELMAAGRCDKQIARALGISGYTVREYVRRSFAKLNISSRTAVLPRLLGIDCHSDPA